MDLKRIKNKDQLFRLRNGFKIWKPENTEPNIGMVFYIHSPFTKSYYKSRICEYTDWNILQKYLEDGNIFVEQK